MSENHNRKFNRSRRTRSSTSFGGQSTKTRIWPSDSPRLPTALRPAFVRVSRRRLYCSSALRASSRVCLEMVVPFVALKAITRSMLGGRAFGMSMADEVKPDSSLRQYRHDNYEPTNRFRNRAFEFPLILSL